MASSDQENNNIHKTIIRKLPKHISLYISMYIYLSVYLSIYLSISIYVSIYLCIYISTWQNPFPHSWHLNGFSLEWMYLEPLRLEIFKEKNILLAYTVSKFIAVFLCSFSRYKRLMCLFKKLNFSLAGILNIFFLMDFLLIFQTFSFLHKGRHT